MMKKQCVVLCTSFTLFFIFNHGAEINNRPSNIQQLSQEEKNKALINNIYDAKCPANTIEKNIADGAEVNANAASIDSYSTPLCAAVHKNRHSVVKLLLEKKAEVNATATIDHYSRPLLTSERWTLSAFGGISWTLKKTPLQIVVKNSSKPYKKQAQVLDIANNLLLHKADITTCQGITDFKEHQKQIARLFMQWGHRPMTLLEEQVYADAQKQEMILAKAIHTIVSIYIISPPALIITDYVTDGTLENRIAINNAHANEVVAKL